MTFFIKLSSEVSRMAGIECQRYHRDYQKYGYNTQLFHFTLSCFLFRQFVLNKILLYHYHLFNLDKVSRGYSVYITSARYFGPEVIVTIPGNAVYSGF